MSHKFASRWLCHTKLWQLGLQVSLSSSQLHTKLAMCDCRRCEQPEGNVHRRRVLLATTARQTRKQRRMQAVLQKVSSSCKRLLDLLRRLFMNSQSTGWAEEGFSAYIRRRGSAPKPGQEVPFGSKRRVDLHDGPAHTASPTWLARALLVFALLVIVAAASADAAGGQAYSPAGSASSLYQFSSPNKKRPQPISSPFYEYYQSRARKRSSDSESFEGAGSSAAVDNPVVYTTKGPVRGVTLQAANGKLVDAFLGIPYAKPPLGKLRFRHPLPMNPWIKPRNCTVRPPTCVQVIDTYFDDFEGATMWNANTNMSEDCLTMLVWVPRPRPTNAAVLLWVYGGGFYSGTATLDVYDGRTLASEENVIVVSFNYRVGSIGFLYLDHSNAPGNAGLMDQVMALRWVQDNIRQFGGNPANVTLFGESAGAVSVAFHLLSPLSRDLFAQAVLQSGGATAPWAYHDRQTALANGYKLAQEVKCPSNNVAAIIKCLRQKDPHELVRSEIFATGVVDFSFIPVVDGAFLTENPEDSLSSGNFKKCRMLLGANRDEGTFFIIYYLTNLFKRDESVYLTREDFVDAVQALSPFASQAVIEAIIFEYTDWLNPDDPIKNRDAVDKIVGDYHFTCPIVEMAHYYSSAGLDVYMYYFVHRSSQNKWPEWMGVIHADEIAYIFGEPLNQTWSYRPDEQQFSKRIMRYWANFARMGNPSLNPDGNWEKTYWPAHTAFGKEFLILDVNSTQVGYGHRARQCAFWKSYLPTLISLLGNNSKTDGDCQAKNLAAPIFLKPNGLLLPLLLLVSLKTLLASCLSPSKSSR